MLSAWRKDSQGNYYLLGKNTVEVREIKPGLTQVSVRVCWYKHSGSDRNKARPLPGECTGVGVQTE